MPEPRPPSPAAMALLCLAGIVIPLTILVYLPGLNSGLLLDDQYNLQGLAWIAEQGYGEFLLGNVSGPTGRPLAMLTFVLQQGSWPDQVWAFKLVNLLIHLACGGLIYAILRRVLVRLEPAGTTALATALLATALWLLHPMHLSTVLYVVQRMAQLSALFVLTGVLFFIHGRQLCERGRVRAGYGFMSAAVVAGTLLAVLCKENGALLPLLLLVVDLTLLSGWTRPPGYARWRTLFLVLPAVLLLGYLAWLLPAAAGSFNDRSYTLGQKLLTEAVVVENYIGHLLLPRLSAFGFFHDDFPLSTDLFHPSSTAPAVLLVLAMPVLGITLRRRAPVPAFALLWFFTGHLLESSFLNLSLYFEHRNYLPSLGLMTLYAWLPVRLGEILQRRAVMRGAVILLAVFFAWISLQNALLWRQPLMMALEATRVHPDSRWAMAELGTRYLAANEPQSALSHFEHISERFPDAVYPRLYHMVVTACVFGTPPAGPDWERIEAVARTGRPEGFDVIPVINTQIKVLTQGQCPALDQERYLRILNAIDSNPNFRRERGALLQLTAQLLSSRGETESAYRHMLRAVAASPTPERQLQLAEMMIAMDKGEEAAKVLAGFEAASRRWPMARFAYHDRLADLQQQVAQMNGR